MTHNDQIKPPDSQIQMLCVLKVFSSKYKVSCSHYFSFEKGQNQNSYAINFLPVFSNSHLIKNQVNIFDKYLRKF